MGEGGYVHLVWTLFCILTTAMRSVSWAAVHACIFQGETYALIVFALPVFDTIVLKQAEGLGCTVSEIIKLFQDKTKPSHRYHKHAGCITNLSACSIPCANHLQMHHCAFATTSSTTTATLKHTTKSPTDTDASSTESACVESGTHQLKINSHMRGFGNF